MTILQRLAVALTALLTLTGAVVVGGYLAFFAASADRAASAVPEDAALYATVYLQPSTGQQLNLADLLGHVPGFADAANLDAKIHDIAAQVLAGVGIDYEADVRPWLGNQLAVAVMTDAADPATAHAILILGVKDATTAAGALPRVMGAAAGGGEGLTQDGVPMIVTERGAYALLDDLLLIADGPDVLRRMIDAERNEAPSLADTTTFRTAMRRLPADHLGAIYVDPSRLDPGGGMGFGALSLALVVDRDAVRLSGSMPFDAAAATDAAKRQVALGSEPSSLPTWMPSDTSAELVLFDVAELLRTVEAQVGSASALGDVATALTQLRAVAALGLGVDVDRDLLPLLDREVGVAVQGADPAVLAGQLLLRPGDPDAAAAALDRIRAALVARGAATSTSEVDGTPITTLAIPEVGSAAFALRDGIVIIGLTAEDVGAAITANASDATLAREDAYRRAWEAAGNRGGPELYLAVGRLVDAVGGLVDLPGDGRDILQSIDALALTAPAHDDATDIDVVLTAR